MFKNRVLGRTGLVLALGMSLSPGTAGASIAAPTGDATAAACPAHGKRFQIGTSTRVYLAGPDGVAYAIPNETVYFQLWNTWDGLTRWPGDTVSSCFGGSHLWSDAYLIRDPSSPKVYIYDARIGRFRWITSPAVFNQYAFASNKIREWPVSWEEISNDNWDN
ncbi:hypothetical protein [Nonomuraea zeae]|uniref:Tachylectin 2 domain-containing protein n=1 Tax=Nonomuraea zeae TaxID=1642303 RepID=A0A5S4GAE1_9ACTN|nr:hypothetical protein [Nonomuraea zeae]TMR29923.1 hypothetical protein ETD85_30880 [Nonomuraea zeae]